MGASPVVVHQGSPGSLTLIAFGLVGWFGSAITLSITPASPAHLCWNSQAMSFYHLGDMRVWRVRFTNTDEYPTPTVLPTQYVGNGWVIFFWGGGVGSVSALVGVYCRVDGV